jgi:hypothetical protein
MKLIAMFVAGLIPSATPASAAPRWVDDLYWRAAQRVTPILTEPEKEAYVANCIADWTAGTPPATTGQQRPQQMLISGLIRDCFEDQLPPPSERLADHLLSPRLDRGVTDHRTRHSVAVLTVARW